MSAVCASNAPNGTVAWVYAPGSQRQSPTGQSGRGFWMANQTKQDASDRFHFHGLWAVVAGSATLLIIAWILVASVKHFASTDAVAILGAIASPIVAIVSAYF